MKFQDFCLKVATDDTIEDLMDLPAEDDSITVPERYALAADVMVSMMKNKRDGFDRINVPFVEMTFNDTEYEKILEEKYPDGEIPGVMNLIRYLSNGIYGKYPSELSVNQKAIIKVLATYICIQN